MERISSKLYLKGEIKIKMNTKTLLLEQIEREKTYLEDLESGTNEYNDSMYRLMDLEKQLREVEKDEAEAKRTEQEAEDNRKDRRNKTIIEGVKVGSGIVLPLIGLVWITATEKESTFTGVLKEYTKYFLPNKR